MWTNKPLLAVIAFALITAADVPDAICQALPAVQLGEVSTEIGSERVAGFIAAFHFNDHLFSASRFALFATTVADVETTWRVTDRGGYELNPVLGQSRPQQALLAGGSVAVLTVATERLYKTGHRKLALIINVVASGEHGFAVWHNAGIKF